MQAQSRFFDRYEIRSMTPALGHLERLAAAFAFLPYENVTKILKHAGASGSASKLRQPEEVLEDHLRWNTGGTCFSLCNTLLRILRSSGYDAWIAMGDMHYGKNIHCAVIVHLEPCRYLLDPGYLLHQPILLPEPGAPAKVDTPMNAVVVKNEGGERFSLYTREEGREKWRYRLTVSPTPEDEFVRHWIHSFSLNSMEHVTLSRVDSNGRIYFRKNTLSRVNPNERRNSRIENFPAADLGDLFGIPSGLIQSAQKALS